MLPASTTPPTLQDFYKTSERYLIGLQARESTTFGPFCDLVRQVSQVNALVLEVGAGVSQASATLAAAGIRVVATDLSQLFLARGRDGRRQSLEPQPHLVAGDGTRLPFAAERFDVVCLHDAIEHIGDQEALWMEVARVLRKGGHVVAVGPNLLSPINPLLLFAKALRSGQLRPRLIWTATKNAWLTFRKLTARIPEARYRSVILREDLHSDADACYLASPVDLRHLLERHGCAVIRYQRDGRTRLSRTVKFLTRSFAPTIWIVAVRNEPKASGDTAAV